MMGSGKKGHRFVDRGDPDSADWVSDDFDPDGEWNTLPLEGIVPKNAKLVLIRAKIKATLPNKDLLMRTKRNSGTYNASFVCTQVANVMVGKDILVHPDEHGVVEYYFSSATWVVRRLVVAGWFV